MELVKTRTEDRMVFLYEGIPVVDSRDVARAHYGDSKDGHVRVKRAIFKTLKDREELGYPQVRLDETNSHFILQKEHYGLGNKLVRDYYLMTMRGYLKSLRHMGGILAVEHYHRLVDEFIDMREALEAPQQNPLLGVAEEIEGFASKVSSQVIEKMISSDDLLEVLIDGIADRLVASTVEQPVIEASVVEAQPEPEAKVEEPKEPKEDDKHLNFRALRCKRQKSSVDRWMASNSWSTVSYKLSVERVGGVRDVAYVLGVKERTVECWMGLHGPTKGPRGHHKELIIYACKPGSTFHHRAAFHSATSLNRLFDTRVGADRRRVMRGVKLS